VTRFRSHPVSSTPQPRYFTAWYRHQKKSSSSIPSAELSTKEELLALVDQYDSYSLTDHLPLLELPDLRQPEEGPHIVISDKPEDWHWPTQRYKWPARGEELKAVERLEEALKDINIHPEESYKLYRALPAPRIPYLDSNTRHRLLHNLGVVERKDEEGMLRYLSVVDDMKATGIPLTTSEWNCATSFAGRYVGKTTEVEVESGLRSWKEMEHVAGVRGNSATFNILFDIATKAGKFKLAEKIYEEMARRGHSFNRFHHVSLIHYYGLRADGDGVRKAYKELIEAGEIVDTVVLNCVISSLFRAYEPQAAEHVYERMKRLHGNRMGAELPSRDFRKRREVTKALMKMAEHAKRDPSQLKRYQNQSIIAPDVQTYRILVQYLAIHAGELHKAVKYLDEMRWFEVPLNGSIFLALFTGFAHHGGIRYTHWTQDRLESVWRAYLQAIDSQHEGLYIGKWMIIWALRAFAKCSNKDRTVEVWEAIKDKWKPHDEELQVVTNVLRSLIET
jgi:pentatricopeptide repeat protein